MNQQYAQGIAALGRGPDSMLVHMAPQEVAGLQALAMKHGGSLTINPETGLPEAGFLSSILPMVAGFALNAFAPGLGTAVGGMFGMGSAAGTALTVGGISALTSGSLSKGLMAGLGAYGGAGLGESLMNAGTGSLSSGATVDPNAVVPQAPVFEPASVANAANSIPASGVSVSSAVAPAGMQPLAGVPGKFVTSALPQPATVPAINAAAISPTVTPTPVLPAPSYPTALSQSAADIGNVYAQEQAAQNAVAKALANKTPTDLLGAGFDAAKNAPGAFLKKNMLPLGALGISALSGLDDKKVDTAKDPGMIRPYTYSREKVPNAFMDVAGEPLSSKERRYFTDRYTALTPYKAPGPEYMAAEGGPVADMSNGNDMAAYMGRDKFAEGGSIGGYTFDPKTGIYTKPSGEGATTVSPTGGASMASGEGPSPIEAPVPQGYNPFGSIVDSILSSSFVGAIANALGGTQTPAPVEDVVGTMTPSGNNAIAGANAPTVGDPVSYGDPTESDPGGSSGDGTGGEARGGLNLNGKYYPPKYAQGGISNLGDYSDGGRLLRGPGDGVSDDIPAMIGQKQQARLADGEFVVPARIVSELGNGSTEAGARQLYAMMDRVQKARKKTVGKDKVATNSRAAKLLPA